MPLKTLQNAKICNQGVGGSNPSAGTTMKSNDKLSMLPTYLRSLNYRTTHHKLTTETKIGRGRRGAIHIARVDYLRGAASPY
jgi:hypothetical protein